MTDITVTEALGVYAPTIKETFPYAMVQTENITGPQDRPEFMHTARHNDFVRIPVPARNAVLWAFQTERARDTFIADFGGEPV